MLNQRLIHLLVVLICFLSVETQAKVYWNKWVGDYEVSFDLENHKGQSFLNFMKNSLYPAIKGEASNRSYHSHIDSIYWGEGVELRLSEDVTTYHVKYKERGEENAERSGRSFVAVGLGPRVRYIADASYKHFLDSLERVLKNPEQAEAFYLAILKIIINSDPSGIESLNTWTKRVAADFVAVYIAEQYRRLIEHDGERLAYRPKWDNAHLHVTLLANFHAGQSEDLRGMYYHGEYQTNIFVQNQRIYDPELGERVEVCMYRNRYHSLSDQVRTRAFDLSDYWQFNDECDRSGVNITRRDFVRMSRKITQWLNRNDFHEPLSELYYASFRKVRTRYNINDKLVDFIVSDRAPNTYIEPDRLVHAIVDYLILIRENANTISENL